MFFHRQPKVKVKICGIQDKETAAAAVAAGADALGFIFAWESKRYISPKNAAVIIASLPRSISTVGVFTDTPPEDITKIARRCSLHIIQLHDNRDNPLDPDFGLPLIRCIRIKDTGCFRRSSRVKADAVLFDTYHPGLAGGTGTTFDWSLVTNHGIEKPVILAGGLDADNVKEAVNTVRPFAVDVSSGVETAGKKDPVKIRTFIERAKEVSL